MAQIEAPHILRRFSSSFLSLFAGCKSLQSCDLSPMAHNRYYVNQAAGMIPQG
jgi:hypothetical protein